MTKSKGKQREQPSSICHPFLPSISPFTPSITEEHNKNTISNLKHSPRVKLDWKPLLKEITSRVEFLILQSARGAREVRGASWRCPVLRMPVSETLRHFDWC
ncbi:hypothetical protein XENOCAPTIV_015855 [Xenoophorus captivus]|uniref:Uncharacterized protein n=1 Tax=Xenoophorus captivus TaxID=1517983 RepID=A0ABV0RB21_9TELE